MRNDQVIQAFLNGESKAKSSNGNLYIHLTRLVNYTTTIAERLTGSVIAVNVKKYSVTTSRIQGKIKYLARMQGLEIVEYNPDTESAMTAYLNKQKQEASAY